MSRIAATFAALAKEKRKALIPFVTAGDPDPALAVPLIHALAQAGADVIELGVPFSDPMADGPTIQRSSERALKHGVSLKNVLEFVAAFRQTNNATPVVLMGYANPIEAMGETAFADRARDAGVDGVLVVDYPPEEATDFAELLNARGIAPIFLLAPTTPASRIEAVARLARGYVYYVSLKGVTGVKTADAADIAAHLPRLRAASSLPIAVGFGIKDAESARAISKGADAVIIGTRIVQEIENAGPEHAAARVKALLIPIRKALDS